MSSLTVNQAQSRKTAHFPLPLYIVHGSAPGSCLILALEGDRHLKGHSPVILAATATLANAWHSRYKGAETLTHLSTFSPTPELSCSSCCHPLAPPQGRGWGKDDCGQQSNSFNETAKLPPLPKYGKSHSPQSMWAQHWSQQTGKQCWKQNYERAPPGTGRGRSQLPLFTECEVYGMGYTCKQFRAAALVD